MVKRKVGLRTSALSYQFQLLFLTPCIIIRCFSFLASSCLWQINLNLTIRPKTQSLEHPKMQVLPTVFVFSLACLCPYSQGMISAFFLIPFRDSSMHRLDVVQIPCFTLDAPPLSLYPVFPLQYNHQPGLIKAEGYVP